LLAQQGLAGWPWMRGGLAVGTAASVPCWPFRVAMTPCQKTVALVNGCGGVSSLLVALGQLQLPGGLNLLGQVFVLVCAGGRRFTCSGSW